MKATHETLESLKKAYEEKRLQALEDWFAFLRFASISSEAKYKEEVLNCANWLQNYLTKMGFNAELWPTKGHPVVYASYCRAGPDQPTLLIYHHYDVQPVDPLPLWDSPPFDPTIRQGQVYARGAQDNKGQCFYTIQALKLLIEKHGSLPINIKLCIEGEEECGSAGLAALLPQRATELQADVLAIVDVGMRAAGRPAVTLGLRGLVTFDLEVIGSKGDLHSGSHGGLAYNPLRALCEMLAACYHSDGSIAVTHFYDTAMSLSEPEKTLLDLSFDGDAYRQMFGILPTGGEVSMLPLERAWLRPTLEINGIYGGYGGEGIKTVIPAKAYAKLSCRLIKGQQGDVVAKQLKSFLEKRVPPGIQVNLNMHPGGGPALFTSPTTPAVQAYAIALEEVFTTPCAFILDGASIPIASLLADTAQADTVLIGLGLPDDAIHAPNEHFGLDRFDQGVLMTARALLHLQRN